MTDSSKRDALAAKHKRNREQRLTEIKRWVEYVQSEPAERWGEQLNRLVDSQLDAARDAGLTAEQYRRVEAAGREWAEDETE